MLVNLLVWFLYLFFMPFGGLFLVLLLLGSGGWLIGMVVHPIIYTLSEARDRAVEAAIAQTRGQADPPPEKPKRDRRARLTEDGELLDWAEAEAGDQHRHAG